MLEELLSVNVCFKFCLLTTSDCNRAKYLTSHGKATDTTAGTGLSSVNTLCGGCSIPW